MKLDLIKIILFIFILNNKNAIADYKNIEELFGDRSIIRKLRDEYGSFQTRTPIKTKSGLTIRDEYYEEQYNFKTKDGRFQTVNSKKEILIYLNDFTEFYFINDTDFDSYLQQCQATLENNLIHERDFKIWPLPKYISIKEKLQRWSPEDTINLDANFQMFGPSHLLFNLIDKYDENKNNVQCRQANQDGGYIRCQIRYKYNIIMAYYFENRGELTMFPIRIKTLVEMAPEYHDFLTEIKYYVFEYSFNDSNSLVDTNLPIGYGCLNSNRFKSVETDLGEQFNLKYDVVLNYLDFEDKDRKKEIYLKTEFRPRKLFIDSKILIGIFDQIDMETKEHFRTYYDYDLKLAYDVDDDKCVKRTLKNKDKLNWIKQLISIDLLPKFLFIKKFDVHFFDEYKISYLGEYILDKRNYSVFEQNLFNYFSVRKHVEIEDDKEPYIATVTHYYPESDKKVPRFIEIRIKAFNYKLLGVLNITINKHKLAISSESFNEKIDMNQCFKRLKANLDYKILNLTFNGNIDSESFNDNYIKYEFIKLININLYTIYRLSFFSFLRIHDINLIKNNNLINIVVKLIGINSLEPLDNVKNFKIIENVKFDESKIDLAYKIILKQLDNIETEDHCARKCIQESYCYLYEFKQQFNLTCRLWIDKEWGEFNNHTIYRWSIVKNKSNLFSKIGIRLIKKNDKEHSSIDSVLQFINELINRDKFNLVLKLNDDHNGTIFNCLKKEVDLEKFNSYYFILAISITALCILIFAIFLIFKFYYDIKIKKKLIKKNYRK